VLTLVSGVVSDSSKIPNPNQCRRNLRSRCALLYDRPDSNE
jgi:hypothetical protein